MRRLSKLSWINSGEHSEITEVLKVQEGGREDDVRTEAR